MAGLHRVNQTSANPLGTSAGQWVKTAEAARLIGLSRSCLKNYRLKQGLLIEGIHWVYTNSGHRTILYNVELLTDWVATRADPAQHLRTIEAYLMAQESKRGNRRKK